MGSPLSANCHHVRSRNCPEKIKGNRFAIKTDVPRVEVSWQLPGIRRDAWANKHPIPTEENKSEKVRGYHLHPDLYDQPEEKMKVMRAQKQRNQHLNGFNSLRDSSLQKRG